MLKKYIILALAGLLATACGNRNQWTVNGSIQGADGQTIVIEASDNGRWYPLDSVKLDGSGRFAYSHEAAGFPDIYRLRLGDKTLYFPIDSIETVNVVSRADAFDSEFTLEGTPQAEKLMEVDKRVMAVVNKGGINAIGSDSLLKRDLGSMLLGDPSGIVAYYIINKKIGGVSIFNPNSPSDLRIIGAVANAYDQFRPNDPRTTYLKNLFLSNRKVSPKSVVSDTLHAAEIKIFDISLYDNNGKLHSLQDLASKGKVIVLNFTSYAAEFSPALNVLLNNAWEKYHSSGLEIFQVSVDADEYHWRQSAKNLPWTTVYNSQADGVTPLRLYNVTELPSSFIIDRNGDIVERVDDPTKLDAAISRRL